MGAALGLAACAAMVAGTAGDLDTLKKALDSDSARERQQAVVALAEDGRSEAWELVLEALADPEPRVADEAQIRLEGIRSREDLEELFGKAGLKVKKGIVAERVAEALGRIPLEIDEERLARLIAHRDLAVRAALFWSVERLAAAGRIAYSGDGKLEKALSKASTKDKDPHARACALSALAAVSGPQAGSVAARLISDEEVSVRCAVASVHRFVSIESVGGNVLGLLALDSAPAVRLQVAEEYAREADSTGARALAGMLSREQEPRVAWRIVELLQDLSGLGFGLDARPWRDWAEDLDADWSPAESSAERTYEDMTSAFAGLAVLSDHLAVLIDMSGSMWDEGEDGRSRKQAADAEVRRLLESISDETLFNVVPYSGVPQPWEDELVPASQRNVSKAIAAFEGSKLRGKGNFWDAFWRALEDPRVDTVMVLTDGAPTGGDRWNLTLMKTLLPQGNRYRKVVLDAILFDSNGFLESQWREMCAATGGRCTTIDL
ncbi:MAG: hypothetical protein QF903_05245 [Planctomycetota bacterium]|jgi:HEAT repeat protein|nr:hypothetical protein [Planctomycetota bacterium]MDP6761818.1 hypothetical protein [Planctomycetota bacterium]MDP6988864.1 hypothetical protein [Planctomycetota bacterium]